MTDEEEETELTTVTLETTPTTVRTSFNAQLVVTPPLYNDYEMLTLGLHRPVMQNYLVLHSFPVDETDTTMRAETSVTIGAVGGAYATQEPESLETGADARFIGGPANYIGGIWLPEPESTLKDLSFYTGSDDDLVALESFRHRYRGGHKYSGAMVFDTRQWMTLKSSFGGEQSSSEITVAMVVALRPGSGTRYGVLSSPQQSDEADNLLSRFQLYFDHGTLLLTMDDFRVAATQVLYTGDLVILTIRMSPTQLSLSVRQRLYSSSRSVGISVDGISRPFSAQVQLGRPSVASNEERLAAMTVFDVAVFGRYLSNEDVIKLAGDYDAIYGVSR